MVQNYLRITCSSYIWCIFPEQSPRTTMLVERKLFDNVLYFLYEHYSIQISCIFLELIWQFTFWKTVHLIPVILIHPEKCKCKLSMRYYLLHAILIKNTEYQLRAKGRGENADICNAVIINIK